MPSLRRGAVKTMAKTWTGEEEELVLGLRTGRTVGASGVDTKVQRNHCSQTVYEGSLGAAPCSGVKEK